MKKKFSEIINDPLRSAEAAAYLEVLPGKMNMWRFRGEGPKFFTRGKTIYYTIAELNKFRETVDYTIAKYRMARRALAANKRGALKYKANQKRFE
jgi:hypothetical protein